MVVEILNKVLFFVLMLASLYSIRTAYYLAQSWIQHERYTMTSRNLFYLGISIAYILMCFITGIKV